MSVNLAPGEQIIFEGHPSWRSITSFYLKGLLIAIAAALLAALASEIGGGVDRELVFLVALAVLALTVVVGFVKRMATTYMITDRRLHIRRGIVSREVQETRLERVQNVNYRQSLFQRIARVGDVDFDTAASSAYDFSFNGVADPAGVVGKVDEAIGVHAAGKHGLGEPSAMPGPTGPKTPRAPSGL